MDSPSGCDSIRTKPLSGISALLVTRSSSPSVWLAIESACPGAAIHDNGLEVPPPDLPPAFLPDDQGPSLAEPRVQWDCKLSLGSANVNSLYLGMSGFCGKLPFISEQVAPRRINLLGLQEARASRKCAFWPFSSSLQWW